MLDENIDNLSTDDSVIAKTKSKKSAEPKKKILKAKVRDDITAEKIKNSEKLDNIENEKTNNKVSSKKSIEVESILNTEEESLIKKEIDVENNSDDATSDANRVKQPAKKTNTEKISKKDIIEKEVSSKETTVDGDSIDPDKNIAEHVQEDDIADKKEEHLDPDKSEKGENNKKQQKKETVEVENDVSKMDSIPSTENEIEKEKEIPLIDYVKLNLDEIIAVMQHLIDDFPVQKIKEQFESLKSNFNKKFRTLITEKKEEFLKEGGDEIDFKFFIPVKNTFNDILQEYKRKRQKYYKEIESDQKQNLEKKLQLIDNLKELIDTAEPSSMYKNFRHLQDEWRKIGQIPHTKYNDVWRTYHHHVERFYDLLHLNNDFRDLDFKHNLEEKTKLIKKVEELSEYKDVNSAFKELQIIHRMWKEDIGPVARDVREEVWHKFSEATKKIHNKRHEYQSQLDAKFKENVGLKMSVIDKIKSIDTEGYKSHKLWQDAINNIDKLRTEFFAIGRVPRSKNEEVWQLFKDATRNFNKAKNEFYKSIKKDQLNNLNKKMQLIEQAESLKDSKDWEIVTEVFKKIQAEWKNIGHVPRRDSDRIWKRFKDACNHYFDQLHNMQDGHNKGLAEVFNIKKELLEKFKNDIGDESKLNIELINKYISDWKDLGVVPVKMRHIESKFNKAIDSACKKLNIDKGETEILKFKNIIETYLKQNDVRKIDNEQLFIRRKVDELTKEIKQLENNISFISNAGDDNPIVISVYKNINKYNSELKIWQRKLSYLKQLDY